MRGRKASLTKTSQKQAPLSWPLLFYSTSLIVPQRSGCFQPPRVCFCISALSQHLPEFIPKAKAGIPVKTRPASPPPGSFHKLPTLRVTNNAFLIGPPTCSKGGFFFLYILLKDSTHTEKCMCHKCITLWIFVDWRDLYLCVSSSQNKEQNFPSPPVVPRASSQPLRPSPPEDNYCPDF